MEGFLTLILLILGLIIVLGQNLRWSVVLTIKVFLSDFSLSDAEGDPSSNASTSSPSSPIQSTSKRIFSARPKKKFQSRRKFRVLFTKDLVWKLSMILSMSWITRMISGMPALDPPTFKRQLIRTFFETSVRTFFLLRRRRLPEFFRQYVLAIRWTLSCVPRREKGV